MAGLVNFFGGAVVSYESLLDRGRREALLRMKKQASALGAEYVFNIKYETTSLGGGRLASIEVLAYGTALTPEGMVDISASAATGLLEPGLSASGN